jgi:hypothetical protein
MNDSNLSKNGNNYYDGTAARAIRNADRPSVDEEMRFKKFLGTIFNLCELSGFHIENRLVVKDKKTGRIYE